MIKKILPWIVFISLFTLVIVGLASKNKLNQYLSKRMVSINTPQIMDSGAALIDSLYNYEKNSLNYQLTFIELGAKGCIACRKMEKVMDEMRIKYPEKVNVVFLNILEPESQNLMKYYGVVSIPTQIILNKNGVETYRHTGYISLHEIELVDAFKKLNK